MCLTVGGLFVVSRSVCCRVLEIIDEGLPVCQQQQKSLQTLVFIKRSLRYEWKYTWRTSASWMVPFCRCLMPVRSIWVVTITAGCPPK